jgi:predicted hydrocarbon binding protein
VTGGDMEKLFDAIKNISKDGKLLMFGTEWTLTLTSAIGELMVRLQTKADRQKVYESGKASGKDTIESGFGSWMPDILKRLGMKLAVRYSKREFLVGNADISELAGWGKFDIIKFDNNEVILSVRDSPIARYILDKYGKQKHNTCSWIMGEQAGIISYFLDKDVDGTETKCLAKGDPYCEFVFREVKK